VVFNWSGESFLQQSWDRRLKATAMKTWADIYEMGCKKDRICI